MPRIPSLKPASSSTRIKPGKLQDLTPRIPLLKPASSSTRMKPQKPQPVSSSTRIKPQKPQDPTPRIPLLKPVSSSTRMKAQKLQQDPRISSLKAWHSSSRIQVWKPENPMPRIPSLKAKQQQDQATPEDALKSKAEDGWPGQSFALRRACGVTTRTMAMTGGRGVPGSGRSGIPTTTGLTGGLDVSTCPAALFAEPAQVKILHQRPLPTQQK